MNKKMSQVRNNPSGVDEKEAVDFIINRFDTIKKSKKINDLISFHTMNKYMLMAHSQIELKNLGNVVANHKKIPIHEILADYEIHLLLALKVKPTTKTHINVIMHVFGSFAKYFNNQEKKQFFELLLKFRENKITIGRILSELEPMIYKFNNTYLVSQTYFLLYADIGTGSYRYVNN